MIKDLKKYNLLARSMDRSWGSSNVRSGTASDSVIWRQVDETYISGTYITIITYSSNHMASYLKRYNMENATNVIKAYLKEIEDRYKELSDGDTVSLKLLEDTMDDSYEVLSTAQYVSARRAYFRVTFMAEVK
jgi:vacuolar-type H+-ATPase subunit C/Vma6